MTTSYDTVSARCSNLVITAYSTSFGWATRLLGPRVRPHVRNIYALVRLADEIVDGGLRVDRDTARLLCTQLHDEVTRAVAIGAATNPIVHAFATTARRHHIDPDLIDAFFESMLRDTDTRAHDNASRERYVYGSAEVVGLMCLRVFMGGDESGYQRLAGRARRLGAAFQKINFLRDLASDRRELERDYFPGLDAGTLNVDTIIADIRTDLAAARPAINALPADCRVGVASAYAMFTELTDRLQRCPPGELWNRRVRVPAPRKALIVARCRITGGRA